MDSAMSDSSASPQKQRPPASVRQPVSCEPCRRRKIKCSRTKPPCDTCRRRGCADNCVYKGARDEAPFQLGSGPDPNQGLMDRISILESLVRRQGAEIPTPQLQVVTPMLSPPESVQPMHNSPVVYTPETASQTSCYSDHLNPQSHGQSQGQSHSQTHGQPHSVGILSSSPGGNIRYEPRSSQWTSVLANTTLSIATPSLDDHDDMEASSGFPFISSSISSKDELISLLPSINHCDYLKDTYFTVFSPLFHILHDPSFHAQYAQFIDLPSSAPVSWLAILFILLSLAVTALEQNDMVLRDLARGPDPARNIRALSKRYREAAMKCLAKQGVFSGKHNVQSLQALVMLVYAMGHSQEHTWVLLGMTYNVAVALACHIDPSSFPDLDPIISEERRRCWAGVMMLYTIQNTLLGNPDPSFRGSNLVKLPAEVDDADITLAGIQEHLAGPTQMSYLLFKFRMYNIAANICHETLSSSAPSQRVVQDLDEQICLAQKAWEQRYHADSAFKPLPIHHTVHLHILHGYAHQLFLLLHRPFFAQSILGLEVPNQSQIRCIASAEAMLDIHRILCVTEAYRPYMWYTNGLGSFHAFHGAAVLAVALLMPIYRPQYHKFKHLLESALLRFELSAGRSKICEKAARILRFMLSAPSPNQPPTLATLLNSEDGARQDEWWSINQMKMFVDRLQPEQWLGPATISWAEWETLMSQMDGIRT